MESSKSARVVYPPGKAPFARTSRKPRNDDLSHGGEKHTRAKKKRITLSFFAFQIIIIFAHCRSMGHRFYVDFFPPNTQPRLSAIIISVLFFFFYRYYFVSLPNGIVFMRMCMGILILCRAAIVARRLFSRCS